MKLGADKEKKKVVFLVVLTGAAAYLLYSNVFSSAPGSGPGASPGASAPRPAKPDARPPPIPLKYYGYTTQRVDGHKRAFFLDGDDIFVEAEGDVVKRRYKVVRIGINSAVVEDTQLNNTQTLPLLAEESAG